VAFNVESLVVEKYRDVEINRETVSVLLDEMRDKNLLPVALRTEGKGRLKWSTFCTLLDVAESTLGIDAVRQLSADALEAPRFRSRTKAARLFLALDDAYRFMLQTRRNSDFPNISAIVRATDDHIDVHAYLDDDVQPNATFFKMMEGAFDQIRILFGVQGVITSEISPLHATYRLMFDPDYKAPSAFFRRSSSICLNLLTLPNLTRIREVLDTRTLRLEEELRGRRAAEVQLNQRESELVRRLENIHDIVLEFDDSGQMTYVSPNILNRLGYEQAELMRDPLAIFPPEHKLKFNEILNRTSGSSDIYQLSLLKKDGTLSWHEISSKSFWGGEHKHLILVARDINERRQLDADKLNAQKLESLGQLSGAIAHDFNNLLVPILGNIELLMEDIDPSSPQAEIADQIKVTATRASSLTKQLLVYSGDGDEQRTFDLSVELHSLLNLIHVTVPKNIRFHHVIQDNKFVYGDAIQLRQAVMNLVSNAAEAIGTGDGDVTLTLDSEGEKVRICVQDTGPGLSELELSQAFEPLFSTKMVGRGLGLSAVQAIVKSHKGEILADSQPGVGTHFEIWLPRASKEADGQKSGAQTGLGIRRVLIVDDEDAVRRVAELYMKRLGYEVMSEGDPEQAVAFFLQEPDAIDLVMLDLMMPKMNGFQVLEAMREVKPDLPAIMVTGFGAGVELDTRHATETTAMLRKPYLRDGLERALDLLVAK
jgi:PAS domain S-box-containing protein